MKQDSLSSLKQSLTHATSATLEAEEKFRLLVESVNDYGIFLMDTEGRIQSWNAGAEKIKGYSADEIIGKHFSTFYTVADIQRNHPMEELKLADKNGKYQEEGWRLRKNGTKFWANVLITAIRDENKNIIGFSKLTRDITDKKRSDELLKMAHSNLEKRVEERTRQLTETTEKLQKAIYVRDEFLSIASHELRTPLTPLKLQIQGLAHTLRKGGLTELSVERIRKATESCDKSITRLSILIDNLLDVSRFNMGKLSLNYEKIDLVELTSEIIERHRQEIIISGSEVSFSFEHPVIGNFDRLRLEQVISNLLTNSLKYGMKRPIEITITNDQYNATILIKDNGIGISRNDFGRIFQRFERATADLRFGGLGLGLYITRQIIEAHGGNINVNSEIGEGSTFIVNIPLYRSSDNETGFNR